MPLAPHAAHASPRLRSMDPQNHMGHNIPDTNLWLRDDDTDADGTINLWDTDFN